MKKKGTAEDLFFYEYMAVQLGFPKEWRGPELRRWLKDELGKPE